MKLFLIRNLDDKGDNYKAWVHRREGIYSGGYLTAAPEVITIHVGRYVRLRNFVNATISSVSKHNERWLEDKNMQIDKSKLAVIEIDLADIANPSIKFHTLDEALALK